jgi:hypothetical protein
MPHRTGSYPLHSFAVSLPASWQHQMFVGMDSLTYLSILQDDKWCGKTCVIPGTYRPDSEDASIGGVGSGRRFRGVARSGGCARSVECVSNWLSSMSRALAAAAFAFANVSVAISPTHLSTWNSPQKSTEGKRSRCKRRRVACLSLGPFQFSSLLLASITIRASVLSHKLQTARVEA